MDVPPPLRADRGCFMLVDDEPFAGVQVQYLHHTVTSEISQLPTGVVLWAVGVQNRSRPPGPPSALRPSSGIRRLAHHPHRTSGSHPG